MNLRLRSDGEVGRGDQAQLWVFVTGYEDSSCLTVCDMSPGKSCGNNACVAVSRLFEIMNSIVVRYAMKPLINNNVLIEIDIPYGLQLGIASMFAS